MMPEKVLSKCPTINVIMIMWLPGSSVASVVIWWCPLSVSPGSPQSASSWITPSPENYMKGN